MDRLWLLITPAGLAWNVPLLLTVTLPPTVNDRAVAGSYCKTPEAPWPTVRLRATAAVSIVTVVLLAITASSAAVGTKPHDQIPGLLQRPEAVEVHVTRGIFGGASGAGCRSSGSKWSGVGRRLKATAWRNCILNDPGLLALSVCRNSRPRRQVYLWQNRGGHGSSIGSLAHHANCWITATVNLRRNDDGWRIASAAPWLS